jgi:hypothetical protein
MELKKDTDAQLIQELATYSAETQKSSLTTGTPPRETPAPATPPCTTQPPPPSPPQPPASPQPQMPQQTPRLTPQEAPWAGPQETLAGIQTMLEQVLRHMDNLEKGWIDQGTWNDLVSSNCMSQNHPFRKEPNKRQVNLPKVP